MSKLKEKLMLSEKGYSDLKKAITACTITNIALLLPSMVACLLFWELRRCSAIRSLVVLASL